MKWFPVRIIIALSVFIIGLKNIWIALPFKYIDLDEQILKHTFKLNELVLHDHLAFIIGLVMVLLAYNLYRKNKTAWFLQIIGLITSISLQVMHRIHHTPIFLFLEIITLVYLLLNASAYGRKTSTKSYKKALVYLIISFGVLFISSSISIAVLSTLHKTTETFYSNFVHTIKLVLFIEPTNLTNYTFIEKIYFDSLIGVFWTLLFAALFVILKPLIIDRKIYSHQKELVKELVDAYGQNPMAYLALEDDKDYFFSKTVKGFCAYTIVGDVMVLCGDIFCDLADAAIFLSELKNYVNTNQYSLLLMNVTDYYLPIYQQFQFGLIKCGEDANFDLESYSLKGGEVAKVRAAINHANKAGIKVIEIHPSLKEDNNYVIQMSKISDEWLSSKNSPELIFMLGKNNFHQPLERRYFAALSDTDEVLGYVVFNPYNRKKGYIAEITRRKTNAPQGVLEKIMYDAFQIFKSEGTTEATLGLSPLYNITSEKEFDVTTSLMNYIYEHMNNFYNFKALHHAKEKYAPTQWVSRYYAFYPQPFNPVYAYSIIRAQLPQKPSILLFEIIKDRYFKRG